jgi:hypothetical protein
MTTYIRSRFFVSSWFILFSALPIYGQPTNEKLLTVAEKSDFTATSSHAEVVALCHELAKASPRVKYSEFGTTVEGRHMPLLVIADPPIETPEEAVRSGKTIVLVFANIHAGEVDGKEGVLILARELALAQHVPLFKNVVWLLAPDYNADGNDRFSTEHRRSQNGPSKGMGIRENANGLDLNRDFVKLESPEGRALVKLIDRWNPQVIVDCHTTNGSRHRHVITYDTNKHPACDARLIQFTNQKMMPELNDRLEKHGGWKGFYYGNFNRDKTEWVTYGHQPRFSTQYCALRNRIGILSESYSYAPYKDRIFASKDFVHSILEFASDHHQEINTLLDTIANDVTHPKVAPQIALLAKLTAMPGRFTVLGYEEKDEDGKKVRIDKEYPVSYIGNVEATYSITRPTAYLVPKEYAKAIEKLREHGIKVEPLLSDAELHVEVYKVTKLTRANGAFQNHRLVTLDAEARNDVRKIPAGTMIVMTNQPLGTLASFLLEPKADDGLATWNYFDDGLAEGKDFPVLRWTSDNATNEFHEGRHRLHLFKHR